MFLSFISPALIIVLIALVAILWIWALMHVIRKDFTDPTQKLIWLIVIVVFPIIGPIAYFLLHRRFDEASQRKFDPDFKHNK